MKAICIAVLAATLLSASCGFSHPATAKVGYDVGVCSPGSFFAAHIEYVEKESITFTVFQTGSTTQVKPEHEAVYTYMATDKEGAHYGLNHLVVVVKDTSDKEIIGTLLNDSGDKVAMVYGIEADGTKLEANASMEVAVCQDLQQDEVRPSPAPDTAQAQ